MLFADNIDLLRISVPNAVRPYRGSVAFLVLKFLSLFIFYEISAKL